MHAFRNLTNQELSSLDIVKYLHKQGADINEVYEGESALSRAADNGYLDVMMYLCENGANLRFDNECCISSVAGRGNLDAVIYLHSRGANIHNFCERPLRLASRNGSLDVVNYLLDAGADPNVANAMEWAAIDGHLEIMKCLYERGVEYSPKCMYLAAGTGHLEVVKHLSLIHISEPTRPY